MGIAQGGWNKRFREDPHFRKQMDLIEKVKIPQYLERRLTELAEDVKEQAQLNVDQLSPKHPQVKTGKLQRSIKYRIRRDIGKGPVLVLYTPVEYGFWLEVGWRPNKGMNSKIDGYPWLVPALKTSIQRFKGRWGRGK